MVYYDPALRTVLLPAPPVEHAHYVRLICVGGPFHETESQIVMQWRGEVVRFSDRFTVSMPGYGEVHYVLHPGFEPAYWQSYRPENADTWMLVFLYERPTVGEDPPYATRPLPVPLFPFDPKDFQ